MPGLETSSPALVAGCDAKSLSLTLPAWLVLVSVGSGDAKALRHIGSLAAVLGTSPLDEVTDAKSASLSSLSGLSEPSVLACDRLPPP